MHRHLKHASSTAVGWRTSVAHASEDGMHLVHHVHVQCDALKSHLLQWVVGSLQVVDAHLTLPATLLGSHGQVVALVHRELVRVLFKLRIGRHTFHHGRLNWLGQRDLVSHRRW